MWRKRLGWLFRRSAGDWSLLCLLVMTLVGLLVSPLPGTSFRAALLLIGGFIAYWVMARWPTTSSRLVWSWWGLILAGALLSFLAPPGMLSPRHAVFRWFPVWRHLQGRLPDTFNKNVIAGALVVVTPFALARVFLGWSPPGGRWSWARWIASLLVSIGMLFTLYLTQSRGAYLAVFVSLFVLLGLSWPRAFPVLLPLGLVAVIADGVLSGWQQMAAALLTSSVIRTLDQRVAIWTRALRIIRDFPLTGAGIGCFQPVMARLYPLVQSPKEPKALISHAHNLYLQVAVDLGLPGLVAYLAILGLAFYMALRAYRRFRLGAERHLALLSAACFASLTGMCVHGLIDSAVWGNKGAFIPWIVLGLCAALYDLGRDKSRCAHD